MKSPFANDLQPNTDITAVFLVLAKDVRQKKTGEPYLSLTLGDRTGDVDAKMWDNVEDILDTFDRDDFVRVRGRVQIYQNKPQFTVHKLVKIDDREVDLGDFFPVSARNIDEMWAELQSIVASFTNPHLKALLELLLEDPEIGRRYRLAPAAKSIHHAWLGGLLEHVLSLCQLAEFSARHYPEVDRDLLLTGVVLHDIGKIEELHFERSFGYTTPGQLLGHIVIAMRMVGDKLRELPDFLPKLRLLVEHMVLSHHGELEYGSPKTPLFLEALLLHHLDNLDSKIESMRQHVKRDKVVDGVWTGWLSSMERPVLKKEVFLAEAPAVQPPISVLATTGKNSSSAANAKPKSAPETGSLFGDKLKDALR